MSTDEDSFIVIEETPSMLQFSILDSISSNRSNGPSSETNAHVDEINSSLFASALPPQPSDGVALTPKIDKNFENTSIKSNGMMHSNVSNISAHTQKSLESNGLQTSSPKSSLAHSFLLGDINCDLMKVNRVWKM